LVIIPWNDNDNASDTTPRTATSDEVSTPIEPAAIMIAIHQSSILIVDLTNPLMPFSNLDLSIVLLKTFVMILIKILQTIRIRIGFNNNNPIATQSPAVNNSFKVSTKFSSSK
jgi:hypothetical protein